MEAQMMDVGQATTNIAARPADPAPSKHASYEARAEWSERYVAWFMARTPHQGAAPADVDSTHRYQVEFFSCVLDPQAYEHDTQRELVPVTVH
jgi:hypothetical protein